MVRPTPSRLRWSREEEQHAEWFEAQLEAIKRVGAAQYLAQSIEISTPEG